jgi:hypothetical protein
MKIRPFLIDNEIVAKVEILKKYANEHPFTKEAMEELMNGTGKCVGDDVNFRMVIPVDYRIVYSIEHQPFGPARHISMSVSGKGNWPNLMAVNEILALFDFKVRVGVPSPDLIVTMWQDHLTESINVVEAI